MFKAFFFALSGPVFAVLGLVMVFFIFKQTGIQFEKSLSMMIALSPIWLPVGLFFIAFQRWNWFVTTKFAVEQGRTTLRIKLPQEVFKSPEAMEAVLNQSYNAASISNLMESYLQGKHPLVLSLELVSIGGEVRFYVNCATKKIKNAVEAQFYAQYPGIEIVEEPVDYAAEITWDPETMDLMSFHLGKKGKEDFMPIKTYVDLGLDKLPKEEEKLDPMAPIIEHIGKIKPHERLWIQFLLKPHASESFLTGHLTKKATWEVAGQKKIGEIMGRERRRKGPDDEDGEEQVRLTMGERDTISAIERNISKYAFETVIRAIYITTDKDRFDGDVISPLLRAWAQFDVIGRNKVGFLWRTDFDYNFISDFSGRRKMAHKKRELEDYKKRYFYPADVKNWVDKPRVFSVEEIATMYHIPGKVLLTPSLTRVESLKREAPGNLPIGTPTHLQP